MPMNALLPCPLFRHGPERVGARRSNAMAEHSSNVIAR
jgi:hypothetical protein